MTLNHTLLINHSGPCMLNGCIVLPEMPPVFPDPVKFSNIQCQGEPLPEIGNSTLTVYVTFLLKTAVGVPCAFH